MSRVVYNGDATPLFSVVAKLMHNAKRFTVLLGVVPCVSCLKFRHRHQYGQYRPDFSEIV